ncbi:MAG: hypothetical protein K0S18_125 [Anaerocolumna sp.]|jgi:hypothetical protein|nr:hypothetical protein [Anaerocolumna sp.]
MILNYRNTTKNDFDLKIGGNKMEQSCDTCNNRYVCEGEFEFNCKESGYMRYSKDTRDNKEKINIPKYDELVKALEYAHRFASRNDSYDQEYVKNVIDKCR